MGFSSIAKTLSRMGLNPDDETVRTSFVFQLSSFPAKALALTTARAISSLTIGQSAALRNNQPFPAGWPWLNSTFA